MAKQDIRVKDGHRWSARPYDVKAAATAINAGEWVIKDGSNASYVTVAADGASTSGSVHIGVAVSNSTATATADGVVYVVDAVDALFVAAPKSAATLLQAIKNTKCVLDVTSGVFTMDVAVTTNGCFLIEDFNVARNEVYFRKVRSSDIAV